MDDVVFDATPKQVECYQAVMQAVRTGELRTICYGGAAGGGKSYGVAAIFCALALQFPGSRWAIIDSDYSLFERNLYPTICRVFPPSVLKYMSMSGKPPRAVFKNGSEILFMNEDVTRDPEGKRWLGLEVNGAWMEQIERQSLSTYQKVQSRLGARWRVKSGPNPFPLMVCTVNPTDGWAKDEFYDPYIRGELPKNTVYIESKVNDNPYLANDESYLSGFEYLDPISKARLLHGDWTAFEKENRFAYAFSEQKHVREVKPIEGYPILISFDFNVDPLAFIAVQYGDGWFHVLGEFQAERKSDDKILAACEMVRMKFMTGKYGHITITGDASGNKGDLRSNITTYGYIQQHLGLNYTQMQAPKANMGLSDSWVLNNTVLSCEEVKIDPSCKTLIRELKQAEKYRNPTSPSGTIAIRKDRNNYKCDHLDAYRYAVHYARKHWKPPGM